MRRSRGFKKLRALMVELDFDQKELGIEIGKTESYMSRRFLKAQEWTLGDIIGICKTLGISYSDIDKYFIYDGERPAV